MYNIRIDIASEFKDKGFKQADKATTGLDKKLSILGKTLVGVLSVRAITQFGKAASQAFIADEKAAKSLLRSPTYLRFRAQQGGWSEAHAHASRTTLAYKQAEALIGREFKIYRERTDKKQPSPPKASRLKEENKDGCAAVVALFFIVPLAAAGGLLWMISINL
jgi:hypothetical protein